METITPTAAAFARYRGEPIVGKVALSNSSSAGRATEQLIVALPEHRQSLLKQFCGQDIERQATRARALGWF